MRPGGSVERGSIRSRLAVLVVGLVFALGLAAPTRSAAQETEPVASCRVGVDILALHSIDVDHNTFDAGFWIWSVCPDDRIKPLDTIEFVNANSVQMSLAGATTVDGVVWSYAKVEGTFRHYWNLTDFPFDRHTIEIRIENADLDATEFVFEPDTDGSAFEPDMPLAGWDIVSFGVRSDVATYQTTYGDPRDPGGTSDYSRLTVQIGLERDDLSSFIKLTFVVYAAFLVSLISFFVNLETPTMLAARLGLVSAGLFAVAVNLNMATSTLGSEDRLTLVGQIHLVTMTAIVLGAVGALAAHLLVERGRSETTLRRFDRNMMMILLVVYILANAWLIGSVAFKYA